MGHIDRRQFVICTTPYFKKDFLQLELEHGYVLSYQKELKVTHQDGAFLLGHAFSIEDSPARLYRHCEAEMRKWAGRWVLLCDKKLFMDACGSLGCYYGYDKNHSLVVSSSLRIISEILEKKWIANYQIKYGDGHGIMDYYPIPYTPIEDILKLLPSQYIDFSLSENICVRHDYMVARYKNMTAHQLRAKIITEMSVVMRNIEKEFPGEVWITLTGGVDSRTNFAIAYHSGIFFKTYTALRNNLKPWDLKCPRLIGKICNIEHTTINDVCAPNPQREAEFVEHCGGPVAVGTEKQQFIANSDVPIKNKAVVLWGTVWEISFDYWIRHFPSTHGNETVFEQIRGACSEIFDKSEVHYRSYEKWCSYVDAHPMPGFDWRRRLHLEQRLGAWMSAACQAIDLFDSVRIAPINCQELIEIMLSFDDTTQVDKGNQLQIIHECCPKLDQIPHKEVDTFQKKIRRLLKSCFVSRKKKASASAGAFGDKKSGL